MAAIASMDPYDWATLAPHFAALLQQDLPSEAVPTWLRHWSDLQKRVREARSTLYRERSRDLTNEDARGAYQHFEESVFTPFQVTNQNLTTKLLAIPVWEPAPEHTQMLRQLRNVAEIARVENAALETEMRRRVGEYEHLVVSLKVLIDDEEVPDPDLQRRLEERDHATREAAWRARTQAWLRTRGTLATLFVDLVERRHRLARNAGLPDYRAYAWRTLGRLDYTPDQCLAFHDAVATEFVPIAVRTREARKAALGLATLRPWDLDVDLESRPPLHPFTDVPAFEDAMAGVFHRVDPEVGALFTRMRDGFLDLGWRTGKQGGGEEWYFPATALPYVLVGEGGTDAGIDLLLHEMGHAYHDVLAVTPQDLIWNRNSPDEMAEFAAIAMTHLARPYLEQSQGGFYSREEARRARVWYLEELVVNGLVDFSLADSFEHWVYTQDPGNLRLTDLDATWVELSARFRPWIDWTELETEHAADWQQWSLLFGAPFSYVTYEMAHIAALQVWQHAQTDPAAAWRAYRAALALGNTRPLPGLYAAAGAHLPFEPISVRDAARFVAHHLQSRAEL